MQKIDVGIIGATGMVGQQFVKLLLQHPWFRIKVLAASERSAGKTYTAALGDKGIMPDWVPPSIGNMPVLDSTLDMPSIAEQVSLVFCAVDLEADKTRALETMYAKKEVAVVSTNSAHRWTPDVPMIIPEANHDHLLVLLSQKRRLGTERGFIVVKPNCSIQPYAPAIYALREFIPIRLSVCTYQALSGAGKTLATFPEMEDNIMPLPGEEDKSESEPLKIWGHIEGDKIVPLGNTTISAQCFRVPVSDGHLAAVSVEFHTCPTKEQILDRWDTFPSLRNLPSSPDRFLQYHGGALRPQTKLDRDAAGGMAIRLGRLRPDPNWSWKFHALAHNTIRGAAGGCILTAELLVAEGYLPWW